MATILTANGIDNTNIDGARNYNFNAGNKSGIVKGAFNEGTFFASSSNIITLDTCELRISGHRIIIDEAYSISLTQYDTPSTATRYSMIAEISVNSSTPTFRIFLQASSIELIQDNLFLRASGDGIYQLEIGRFTLNRNLTIEDVVRTADIITGGLDGENTYINIGETTTTLTQVGTDAEVDIENVIEDNITKTNFNFTFPLDGILSIITLTSSTGTLTLTDYDNAVNKGYLLKYNDSIYVNTGTDSVYQYFYSTILNSNTGHDSTLNTDYTTIQRLFIKILKATREYQTGTKEITFYNKNQNDNINAEKQDKITSNNKLNADLIDTSSSNNQFVSNADKQTWNNKQDALQGNQLDAVNSGITSLEVTKIYGIEDGAQVNVQPDWNQTDSNADDYIKNKPNIISNTNQKVKTSSVTFGENDVVQITAGTNIQVVGDSTNKTITISATDTTYQNKTASQSGTDVSLVTTGEKYNWNNKSNFSGNYNDLTNKPTIPTDTNQKVTAKLNGSNVTFGADAVVEIKAGTNVSITPNTSDNTITINASGGQTAGVTSIGGKTGAITLNGLSIDNNNVLSGMSNPMTTAGDIIIGDTSGTPTRLAKGSNGQVLGINSSTGELEWQTPSGGGGITNGVAYEEIN